MANKIVQISKRAKAIRKAKPGIAWQSAIKQASKELKGKSGARGVKKKASTTKVVRRASRPSTRTVTRTTTVKSVGAHNTVTSQIATEISRRNAAESELSRLRSSTSRGLNAQQKKDRTRRKAYLQKTIAAHKKIITQLKGLI